MDIENLIKDTFTAHEQDAPDSDQVLAATRQRLDRGRAVVSRPLAAAAGVVLLVLAAVAVVALNRPAPDSQVATGTGQTSGPAAVEAPAEAAIAELTMPYSLGWLPPGKADYLARRINIGGSAANPDKPVYGGEYMLTVTSGRQVLLVDVQEMRMMPVEQATFKSGPGRPVTIGGRAGVESSHSGGPGGYEVYLTHPDGGSLYVNVAAQPGSTAVAQQLIDAGRRVAENVTFPGKTTVTPAFGLGKLPDGLRMCTFDVEKGGPSGQRTSYSVGTCSTLPPVQVRIDEAGQVRGTAGQPVQGHATRYLDENGYRTLWILKAVHDAPIAVAGAGAQAELYAIADHLVLPH
ncbi:hypothetical protein DMA12_11980 [Amycolatopsis balhimycina DSM 5908]|uniref:Uncharacterized protein n=1 Tax=Amycolatopsis balhimycina DSM 5908 TaxID=1081091 RepID=A0A428WSG2_AMYBA|nr:hypothetical protein [Amycolatopsis balhimycina]RSM46002.1 hypothetical protein DMA12_11980 [Amycolatopsis balhimycina DSM 5908]